MKWSLKVGKIAGIKLLLHWTFLLLILWIAFSQLLKGYSLGDMLFSLVSVLSIFLCVVLHELGHALTAKKYNIQTRKIILLPIGGIADLERIPEEPRQELIIAIAGPLVNLVIAGIIYFTSPVNDLFLGQTDIQSLSRYQIFWSALFSINVLLFLFNLIPAFPMDGGRILRAFLAFYMNRAKATTVAANIGQFIAILFIFGGLFYNPFLSLIGVFIFFGAYSENFMIQHQEFLRRFLVRDAMMTQFTKLHPTQTIQEVSDKIIAGSEADFIIIENDTIKGILSYPVLIQALKQYDWNTQVQEIMITEFESIAADEHLDQLFMKLQRNKNILFPVIQNEKLAGVINLNNINEFLMIRSALH